MNIQIEDEVEVVKQGKRKTIQLKQTNFLDEKIQPPKQQDIQVKQQKLSIVFNQTSMKEVENLNQRLNHLINDKNQHFQELVIVNGLNFVMQKKFVIKTLSDLNKLKIKKINYYQITKHPVGLVLKALLLLLQQLNNSSIEEINIIIAPYLQLSQNSLSKKGQSYLKNLELSMQNLKKARIKIQKQFFTDFEIRWLYLLLNTISQSEGLNLLSIDLSKCKFENDQFNKEIFDLAFSKFQQLKSLSLNLEQIEKNKEIILNKNIIENVENLNLSFASIYLDSKLFHKILRFIEKQKQLVYLDLNLTLCTLDAKKLEKLIAVLLEKNLKTLLLDLSENIFCQTQNHIPFQEQGKCNLINLNLKLNQCVWLSDLSIQPSPDLFLLTAFNFHYLCLDLSGTKLDYDSLDTLGRELAASNCKALTIQQYKIKFRLNNTRINFEQVIYFSKTLQSCQDLLYLDVNLKNNQFDQTQIELILAAFIQMQLIQLNIYFDIDIRSKLVKNYALNNFCLLKSNLVNKQIQKVLHTRRILIHLMHKLEKFHLTPNIIQFLYDIWI